MPKSPDPHSAPDHPPATHSDKLTDARVERAMELYLNQLESGTIPDRVMFLKQFPDIADELSGQLDALDFLHVATPEIIEHEAGDAASEIPYANATTLGDFRLVRQIGSGGMGIVYEAIQLSLDRRVAVKILPFAAMFDAKKRKRFKNEARAAATLDHPNIVPIYFVGQARGVHFYAMQLIEGQSLMEWIDGVKRTRLESEHPPESGSATSRDNKDTPDFTAKRNSSNQSGDGQRAPEDSSERGTDQALSPTSVASLSTQRDPKTHEYFRSVAELGIQVARALQQAHDHGIVHRDIKPGNLMLDESGKVWITDFGLARFEANETMTGHGDVLGTAAYMSPEQISGSSLVDARSDLFSLAATLYELLTLRRPFGEHRESSREGVTSVTAATIKSHNREVPNDLQTIIEKALEESPLDRYQSAAAFADDLQRFVSGHTIQARRPSWGDRTLKWIGRHQRLAASIGIGTMLLCAILLTSTISVWRARSEVARALMQSEQRAVRIQDLLYLADMQVAYKAWNNELPSQVREILNRHLPEPGRHDRRGYEWYALHSLAKQIKPKLVGRHAAAANQLAPFPDGRRVASVGDDKKLRIWDLDTNRKLLVVDMGDSSVEPLFSVAVSPDGKWVATGSDCVQIWNAETGQRQMLLTSYDRNVQSIAFSPDGQRIAVAARYDEIRVFSTSGELINAIDDPGRHESLEFTPDSQRIIIPSRRLIANAGNNLGLIRIWNADLTQLELELHPGLAPDTNYTVATCSSDGRFFAISEHDTLRKPVRLVDSVTGRELLQLNQQQDQVRSIALSADRQILAVGYRDGIVAIWNLRASPTGELSAPSGKQILRAHVGEVTAIRFAGNRRLLTCGRDGAVKAWDLPATANPELRPPSFVANVELAPQARVFGFQTQGNFLLANRQGQTILKAPCKKGSRLSFSRDASLVATTCQNDRYVLKIWKTETGQPAKTIHRDLPLRDLDFSPVHDQLATLDSLGRLTIWQTDTWHSLGETSLFGDFDFRDYRCQFSPQGTHILCSGREELVVVDTRTLESTNRFRITNHLNRMRFSRNGQVVAAARTDGAIELWNWPSMSRIGKLSGHRGAVEDIAFTPDNRIMSIGIDGTTRIWSVEHRQEFGILDQRSFRAIGLSIASDGRQVFVGHNTEESNEPGLSVYQIELPRDE